MEQTAGTQELETQVQAPEESQAPETVTDDVVTEEEVSVEEPVEEEVSSESEPEPKEEEPKKAEEELPFAERPGVKERLSEIEEKYGSKATYWDAIAEISQSDPQFRLLVLEKLEASGKLPAGTVDAFKKKSTVKEESKEYVNNLPEDVRADLEVARQLRIEREAEIQKNLQEAETFFANFEQQHPGITNSPNPARTRNLIFTLASELVERDGEEFESAMEQAYKTVVQRKQTENQEVERAIQATQENASAITSGTAALGKTRKLTQEEKRAAELAGIPFDEYIKYKDSSEDDIFENL